MSILLIILILPLLGAIGCAIVRDPRSARNLALIVSLLCVAVFAYFMTTFNWDVFDPQGGELDAPRIEAINFRLDLGIDSISLWLCALTLFLQPLAIAASFASIRERAKEYYAWMLILLTAMLGVFMARDALLFYVFFELTLVPMFFIIGIWGGSQRRYAAGKFFLFTFTGSVFTLAAIIYLGVRFNTFDLNLLPSRYLNLTDAERFWITLGFLAGFAVKVPLFPVHTWLPLAHTEAPTAGSVILAGVLLKLGTYGILRLVLPIGFIDGQGFSAALTADADLRILLQVLAVLCLIGIIYGALVAWVQQDIKKLVAYSSVSHLGFCVLGLIALNHEGVQGSVLYMINHGLSTGAMFLVIGMIYDRYHTRDIKELSGLAKKMPIMAFFFVLFVLSGIGLPGLNGFPSEFLTILSAFRADHLGIAYGAFAALGIILGAVYMLHMTARVIWGPLKTPGHGFEPVMAHGTESHTPEPAPVVPLDYHDGKTAHAPDEAKLPRDLSPREIGILIPIALAVIILGVIPGKLLKTLERPVSQLIGEPKSPVPAKVDPTVARAPSN